MTNTGRIGRVLIGAILLLASCAFGETSKIPESPVALLVPRAYLYSLDSAKTQWNKNYRQIEQHFTYFNPPTESQNNVLEFLECVHSQECTDTGQVFQRKLLELYRAFYEDVFRDQYEKGETWKKYFERKIANRAKIKDAHAHWHDRIRTLAFRSVRGSILSAQKLDSTEDYSKVWELYYDSWKDSLKKIPNGNGDVLVMAEAEREQLKEMSQSMVGLVTAARDRINPENSDGPEQYRENFRRHLLLLREEHSTKEAIQEELSKWSAGYSKFPNRNAENLLSDSIAQEPIERAETLLGAYAKHGKPKEAALGLARLAIETKNRDRPLANAATLAITHIVMSPANEDLRRTIQVTGGYFPRGKLWLGQISHCDALLARIASPFDYMRSKLPNFLSSDRKRP